jgi:uncharacterized repeat protein (TIGR01451 family)
MRYWGSRQLFIGEAKVNIYCKRRSKGLRQLGLAALVLVILGVGIVAQTAPPGPYLVKDINVGADESHPEYLTDVNGTPFGQAHDMLFFRADDGVYGWELWMTDGTEAGTVLVKDINPRSGFSYLYGLINVDGTLFFSADDGVHGVELWASDGTEAGTMLVKDISPGSADSFPGHLTDVNGTLFFWANDGVHGRELYKSDGTEAGTVLVKDIKPGSVDSYLSELTNVNGTLFFVAGDDIYHSGELWKSDGTQAGTVLVKYIEPGPGYYEPPGNQTKVDGTLFFGAYYDVHDRGLWKSDGTEAGTVLIKGSDTAGSGFSYPRNLSNVNGTLFFSADDGIHGFELYKSDGTEAGTVLVKDINPGSADSNPYELTNVGGTLFFSADDGVHGRELYKSDGTEEGTVLVKDIRPRWYESSDPYHLNYVGSAPFDQGHDVLLFSADDGVYGRELWMSDGTDMGTVRVSDINPGEADSNPEYITRVDDIYFFVADDGVHGEELWARNPGVDLALSKKVITSTTFLLPRDTISYTLTFRNVGDAAASSVVISDPLPNMTQLNVSSSGAVVTYTPGVTYAWQVEDLEPGEGGVISITAVIDPAFAGGVITNTATISSAAAEVNGDNNSSAVVVIVQPPVRVFKTVQGLGGATTLLLPGDVVTYTITLDNRLNELVAGVVLTDPLPAGVRFGGWVQQGSAQLSPPAGTGTPGGEVISWGPWDMSPGEDVSFVFTATVTSGSAFMGSPVVNTAWFSSSNAGSGFASAAFRVKFMDVFLPMVIKY